MQVETTAAGHAEPTAARPATTPVQWLVLFGVALLAIIVDQVTKAYAAAHLDLYESWVPVKALEPVFQFTLVHNTGAAFGMFKDGNVVFSVIAVTVSGIIIFYYRHIPPGMWLARVALGLQLAGALGNVIDRLRHGYVVDFFDVTHWPVFNVADSCIVVGVGLLLLVMFYDEWQANRNDSAVSPNGEAEAA